MSVDRVNTEDRRDLHSSLFRLTADRVRVLAEDVKERTAAKLTEPIEHLRTEALTADLLHLRSLLFYRHLGKHFRKFKLCFSG